MTHEKRAYEAWLSLRERIKSATALAPINEGQKDKKKRLRKLKRNFVAFAKYYFPHYLDSGFGYFHKETAAQIAHDKNIFAVLEWPREHAKSVFSNVFLAMWLKARGELSGMIVGSANQDKASGLLSDLQAELLENKRFINDFGQQSTMGDWRNGHFMDSEGCGYWAFGRGQSPRGVRKAAKRPNFGVIDDIDDKVIVKNPARVREALNWILEDFYGALSIQASRLVIAGNRIHKGSILAHIVGDVEVDDQKRTGIYHSKVFAIEHAKGVKGTPNNGQPAWKERYTLDMLNARIEKMGYRASRREYFHEHVQEGLIFQNDWIQYAKPPEDFDEIITYCDPSFKDTKKSDYKAIVTVGRSKSKLYVLGAWVRQASITAMVKAHYDIYEVLGAQSRYYIEANMLQSLFLDDFDEEADRAGYHVPIRADKRKKPDKFTRIENLSPLFERGKVFFNEQKKNTPDMQMLVTQLLAFGSAAHDDGPDALEGAVSLIQRGSRRMIEPRMGKFRRGSRGPIKHRR